jgi:hypothetical protein
MAPAVPARRVIFEKVGLKVFDLSGEEQSTSTTTTRSSAPVAATSQTVAEATEGLGGLIMTKSLHGKVHGRTIEYPEPVVRSWVISLRGQGRSAA